MRTYLFAYENHGHQVFCDAQDAHSNWKYVEHGYRVSFVATLIDQEFEDVVDREAEGHQI